MRSWERKGEQVSQGFRNLLAQECCTHERARARTSPHFSLRGPETKSEEVGEMNWMSYSVSKTVSLSPYYCRSFGTSLNTFPML